MAEGPAAMGFNPLGQVMGNDEVENTHLSGVPPGILL